MRSGLGEFAEHGSQPGDSGDETTGPHKTEVSGGIRAGDRVLGAMA